MGTTEAHEPASLADVRRQALSEVRERELAAAELRMAPQGECVTCDRERAAKNTWFPSHNASRSCQSGGHNHCTCRACF